MTTIGNESRPAYVYDADTDTWVPIGVGPHTHDEYIDKTIITAKGDIIVGTASEAVAKLGVGPEGSVLIADPTSPTGLAWGEAGGSITVSTTAPEEPGEGDLWFNSTNATTYIYYDGFWVEQSPAIAGPKGEPGVVASASEPSDTDVLWLDTDEESDVPVPAGGTTGQVLIKSSSDNYDTDWANPPSGNAIINGAFDIWQRGTTFTNPVSDTFTADRFRIIYNGTGASRLVTRQALTPGDIAGYGGQYFTKIDTTVAGTGATLYRFYTQIEDVRTFAGQTATFSFYIKAAANTTVDIAFGQSFGSGGSTFNTTGVTTGLAVTTSWQRVSATVALDSVVGKTIGDGSQLQAQIRLPINAVHTFDITGVQLETGTVATPFRRNANSLQGELAACQRYYQRVTAGGLFGSVSLQGSAASTTVARVDFPLKTPLRIAASAVESGNVTLNDGAATVAAGTIVLSGDNSGVQKLTCTTTGLTQFRPYILTGNNNVAGFIAISAEL